MPAYFVANILDWYFDNARSMPWRNNPDPYAVWVSEIMLQQTRVDTVLPYYQRWMEAFPTLQSMAESDLIQVLNMWEGLGYYSRARNLHKAAKIVMNDFGGEIPQEVKTLKILPGIGPYTAGAIASFAFDQDEPLVDGNVRRVLARLFNIEVPVDKREGEKVVWEITKSNLPMGQAGDYNQALMELGAVICLPKKPLCHECPVQQSCKAYAEGVQEERPILTPKDKIPHYTVSAAVIIKGNQVLIAQRPESGLLGGMWEFPGGKLQPGEKLDECLRREICEELGVKIDVGDSLGVYRHAYTHFRITLHAFQCSLLEGKLRNIGVADHRWVTFLELDDFPMGKIDRSIANRLLENRHFEDMQHDDQS